MDIWILSELDQSSLRGQETEHDVSDVRPGANPGAKNAIWIRWYVIRIRNLVFRIQDIRAPTHSTGSHVARQPRTEHLPRASADGERWEW